MTVLPIPFLDPVRAFAPWAGLDRAMLLDSAAEPGRYSYLAPEPVATLSVTDEDPFAALDHLLARFARPSVANPPVPFIGGAIGVLSYEAGRWLERAPARHCGGARTLAVGVYETIAAFDHQTQRAWTIGPDAEALAARLAAAPPLAPVRLPPLSWRAVRERAEYCETVRRVIAYIEAGDVFQVNLTTAFGTERPSGLDAFALYRLLRRLNPAPFGAHLNLGAGSALLSASPERFVALSATGRIETRPIKGTAPRHPGPVQDQANADALKSSAKDRAENLMITDLLRNDIGRVAEIGSVRVPVLAGIESFANVHHLVSVIEGQLRSGLGPVDLLRATFPGGSVTGAPKVRAMEIIDELEPGPRGAYCGCAFWIGFDGAMDSSIPIRTLSLSPSTIIAQAGGGIVADSSPQGEWDELMTKAAPALAALSGGCA